MLPFSWYILKVIICSGILFGYYWLFLRNKIFHQYNRFYLLTALALSLSLPMLKIDFWQQYTPRQSQVIKALQVVSAGDDYMNNVMITANDNSWNMRQLYTIMYWAVSLVFLLVLIRTLFVIRSLLKKYPVQLIDKFSFVNTDDKSTPFSFLKYIFWNANIDMDTPTGKQIFKHEVAHIQEKHTYDKLLINITLIFFWCNPFFWLYRKELNMIHEFIADKKAVEDCDTAAFAEMILQATYPQHRFQLTNNFFYSPIKRRLLMLTKNNNPKISYGARLMVLPLAVLVFTAFSFKVKDTNKKLKSTVLIPVHDTIPARSVGLQAEQIPAIEEIDPKKALLVVNGKIIGKGAENDAVFNQLYAAVVNVAWLQKKAALAKYGNEGAEGACEVTYTNGVTIKTACVDENKKSVFYIGIDNSLAVNAQDVKSDDLFVKVSAGKIQGMNGRYIVKVFQPGEISLTLLKKDGTKLPGEFTVTAKLLPDPANVNLKEYLKGNYADTIPLKEKLLIEERLKEKLTDAEKELRLNSINNLTEKIVLEQKIENQDLLNLQQKTLMEELNVIKAEQAKKELLLKSTNTLKEQAVLGYKLKNQHILNEKQSLLLQQQSKTNLTLAEKQILEKTSKDLLALTVQGQKLQNQELLNTKQNLMLAEQNLVSLSQAEKKLLNQNKEQVLEKVLLEQKELIKSENNKVFTIAEVSPHFTGGDDAWKKYLQKNIKPLTPVDEGWSEGTYVVIVKFIVLTDGSVIDVTTENYKGTKTALHCIEVIKNAPKWQPAIQNGHKVKAYKRQAITFVIEEQK